MADRSITVSTDVFAKLWSLRKEGEHSENDILSRIFSERDRYPMRSTPLPSIAADATDEVFSEGLCIFRKYHGKLYKATFNAGSWICDDPSGRYMSLNQLSKAIGVRSENAWQSWMYTDEIGQDRVVSSLRKPDAITKRPRISEQSKYASSTKRIANCKIDSGLGDVDVTTWAQDLYMVILGLGGVAPLSAIYKQARLFRWAAEKSIAKTFEAVIRRTLENHSSDSQNYKGGPDLFFMPHGKGAGIWATRDPAP